MFTIVLVLIPVVNASLWTFINDLPTAMQETILPVYVRIPLPASARVLGFIVALVPASVVMYGTVVLIRLFRLYETGQIFRPANVHCFRSLSRTLVAWCAANIVSGALMSMALTLHHPAGQRMISVGLGSPDITALLVGLVLGVIAWVMEEGSRLQEEQDYTV